MHNPAKLQHRGSEKGGTKKEQKGGWRSLNPVQSHGDTVNLFKLRAMFQRVQQLLLAGPNRNRAKRAARYSGSLVLYRGGRSGTAGSPLNHLRHERSLFPSFLSYFPPHILLFSLVQQPLAPFKRYTPVRTWRRARGRAREKCSRERRASSSVRGMLASGVNIARSYRGKYRRALGSWKKLVNDILNYW